MKNEECRMKNENYSSYVQGKMHSSFFILHSLFFILHLYFFKFRYFCVGVGVGIQFYEMLDASQS